MLYLKYYAFMLYFLKLCFIMLLTLVSSRQLDHQYHVWGSNHMSKVVLRFLCFWVALVIIIILSYSPCWNEWVCEWCVSSSMFVFLEGGPGIELITMGGSPGELSEEFVT